MRYRAYYWEPSFGIKLDLGLVEHPAPGAMLLRDSFSDTRVAWKDYGGASHRVEGRMGSNGKMMSVIESLNERDLMASVATENSMASGIVLGYQDANTTQQQFIQKTLIRSSCSNIGTVLQATQWALLG